MDQYKLKRMYQEKNPNGHFFDRKTLKFFGERMRDMYVYKTPESITTPSGDVHECWRLRKRGDCGVNYAFFDTTTFENVIRN